MVRHREAVEPSFADIVQAALGEPRKLQVPAAKSKATAKSAAHLRSMLRLARRFKFEDTFTREVVQTATVASDTILRWCPLARLPFDIVWIEFDQTVRVEEQHRLGTCKAPEEDLGRAGMLLTRYTDLAQGWSCKVFGEPPKDGGVYIFPVEHIFGDLGHWDSYRDLIKAMSEAGLTKDVIGSGWGYGDEVRREIMLNEALFRRGWSIPEVHFWFPTLQGYGDASPVHRALVQNSAREKRGDLRFLVAALCAINTPKVRYVHAQPLGSFHHRLRNHRFLDVHTVELRPSKVSTHRILDRMAREYSRRVRRHQVRGFWRRVEGRGSGLVCRHEIIDSDETHALCGKCASLLKWIPDHERGDATLGWIEHDYRVR